MAYTLTDWVDGVTPVNAANLDKIEAGVLAAVEKDTVESPTARLVATKQAAGDANETFKILGSGEILWGGGGALVLDVNLKRLGPAELGTEGFFTALGGVYARAGATLPAFGGFMAGDLQDRWEVLGSGKMQWGPGGSTVPDTNLYRLTADILATDDRFVADGDVDARVNGAGRVTIGAVGPSGVAGALFGSAFDTNLYRSAAGSLKTDGVFRTGLSLVVNQNDGAGEKIYFGSALDTNLYRAGADILKTDDTLYAAAVATQIGLANQIVLSNDGHLYFGSAADTNLYRAAANVLKTDGRLIAADAVYGVLSQAAAAGGYAFASFIGADSSPRWRVVGSDGKQEWGPGGAATPDTNLYRAAANQLKTDGAFFTGSWITVGGTLYFGSGQDTNLYRAAAGVLATAGDIALRYGAADQVYVGTDGSGRAAIRFGNAYDTNLYRAAAGVLKTDGAIATASYGTTFPASPVDGQEYTLVDSTTNPTYTWRFRYNAGSSSAYKWEFVGGAPFYAQVDAAITPTPDVWSYHATGPSFVTPRAGDYLYDSRCTMGVDAFDLAQVSVCNASVSASPIGAVTPIHINPGYYGPASVIGRANAIGAGQTLRQCYWNGATNGSAQNRFLAITPIRVS